MVGLYNMFTGGALIKGAIGALGIMPYISASIIFQLMTAVVPALSRLPAGRRRRPAEAHAVHALRHGAASA
jgi:preprotein translocase subunit SecY